MRLGGLLIPIPHRAALALKRDTQAERSDEKNSRSRAVVHIQVHKNATQVDGLRIGDALGEIAAAAYDSQ
jgi:hypothetical protein